MLWVASTFVLASIASSDSLSERVVCSTEDARVTGDAPATGVKRRLFTVAGAVPVATRTKSTWTRPQSKPEIALGIPTVSWGESGIWKYDQLITHEDAEHILSLSQGLDPSVWQPCYEDYDAPPDMSGLKACSTNHSAESLKMLYDDPIVRAVFAKASAMWNTDVTSGAFVKYKTGAPEVKTHTDVDGSGNGGPRGTPQHGTLIVYLTDSEKSTTNFPNAIGAPLRVQPRKGGALTWLGVDEGGLRRDVTMHGISEVPVDEQDRVVFTMAIMFPAVKARAQERRLQAINPASFANLDSCKSKCRELYPAVFAISETAGSLVAWSAGSLFETSELVGELGAADCLSFGAAAHAGADFVALPTNLPGASAHAFGAVAHNGVPIASHPFTPNLAGDDYDECDEMCTDHDYSFSVVEAGGDPHLKDGRGGKFDFKGNDSVVYNLLSTNNVTVNALFKHTDYYDAGINKRLVHGSFMTAAYVSTKISDDTVLQIEYDATRAVAIAIGVAGSLPTSHTSPMSISIQNVTISLKDRKVTVIASGWVITATSKFKKGIIRGTSCATGKCFLSVSIVPTFDADSQLEVSPHGLLGQAFDGSDVRVIGKTDEYKGTVITTSAMGEGAIEGSAIDYEVADMFATAFKFSRWGLTVAKPRNVSTLSGMKVERTHMPGGRGADMDIA